MRSCFVLLYGFLFLTCYGYKAAVIEHQSVTPSGPIHSASDAAKVMNSNLDKLEPNIHSAKQQGADIVLLSEMGITSLIKSRSEMYLFLYQVGAPNQGLNSTACNNPSFNSRPVLQRVSCIAANNSIYLAVNWGDIVPCNPKTDHNCPSDDHYQYNTEIVFDSTGQIIAKYYKIHTFLASEFDTPKTEQYVYFTMGSTKIGIITCFDSMYATPLIPLINKQKISNFIVSHWWNNQYAMFSAASWWQAISRRMKINLLASATWWTSTAEYTWSSGSGIYSSGNILASWYNHERSQIEKLLVADVTGNGGPATDLPPFNGYATIPKAPGSMCVQKMEWEYNKIEVGKDYTGSVKCGNFTCSVDFKVNKLDSANKEYWFLYTDTGYYIQADGNAVYYYEEFCTFYKCYLTSGCLSSSEQMKDDTGATNFDHITVSGTYIPGSVTYAMAAGGDGDVYKNIMQKVSITEKAGVTTATAANIDDVLINLSVIGRKYSLDAKVATE